MSAITVVFYTRNRVGFLLDHSLKTLNHSMGDFEVLVLEDNSIDKLRSCSISWFKHPINICEIPSKSSCAHLWNLGLVLSNTRYVMLCNDDICFSPDWFERTMGFIQKGYEYIMLYQHGAFVLDKKMVSRTLLYADERFETGCYEDCDLCLRAFYHKVKLTNVTEEAIITHPDTGGAGWTGIQTNKEFYIKKWGTDIYSPGSQNYAIKKIDDPDWYPSFTKKWASL